jgi:probable O-glycosylation ligase (exosortase A-associated)
MFIAGTLPATAFMAEHSRLMRFTQAWVIFHIILGITAFRSGGRGPGAFLGDENDLALALNMALPYAFLIAQSPNLTPLARNLYRLAAGVLIVASVFTWSRGGFLGLIACLGLIWLMSKNKIKNLVIICVLGVSVVTGFSTFSGKSVLAEFETIDDPNDSTRRDRIDSWSLGWEMFLDNPVFGVGVTNYGWRVAEYQVKRRDFDPTAQRVRGGRAAHSLYFTLMPEMGLVGIVLFVSICWLIVKRVRRVLKMKSEDPLIEQKLADLRLFAKAVAASLGAYLISGAFITVIYYPHLFYMVGFAVALGIAADRLVGNDVTSRPARRGAAR